MAETWEAVGVARRLREARRPQGTEPGDGRDTGRQWRGSWDGARGGRKTEVLEATERKPR